MSREHEDDAVREVPDGHGDGEERHDPDERSGRGAEQARVGRDELSGRLMMDFEPGPGEDEGEDELALRRLFHGAVSGLEPSAATLDHLRRAVPARRARKRQALVGAAAAAVLIGTAVPAFIHVAGSPGVTAANPALAGHGEQAQGGTGAEAEGDGPASTKAPSSKVSSTTGPTQGATDKGDAEPDPTGSRSEAGAEPGSAAGSVPTCGRGTLRSGGGYNSGPDSTGVVYGGFTIVNGSGSTCRVEGSGLISLSASGAADPGRISVVRHFDGDPATGLPPTSADVKPLLLKPGGSYQLKFAWVPSASCSTDGGGATPTTPTEPTEVPTEPTPTPTEPTQVPTEPTPTPTPDGEGTGSGGTETGGDTGTGTGTEAGTDSGLTTQLLRAEPAAGSVAVSYTAEPGDPTVTTVLDGACAGTLYRTGMLKS
ncbi:hypothetical protein [Streptomyces roseolus]|uniref:hypothetical protein n=1 Tax=Streptomyces roseolus TaxID=67358 RepID=UPI00365DFD17